MSDLLIENGADVSIEEVASRSGVAKTTIYRHWPNRSSLFIDAVRQHIGHISPPDTGSLRGDIEGFFAGVIKTDLDGQVGRLYPCLVEAATRDPLVKAFHDRLGEEREQAVNVMIARAQDRGELPAGIDHEITLGTVIGPILFHKMIRQRPVTKAYVSTCVDVAIAGLHAIGGDRRGGAASTATG